MRTGAALLFLVLLPAQGIGAEGVSLTHRGSQFLPEMARDQLGRQFAIHGLSGITHAGGNEYWAVMDNSNKLVHLRVKFNEDGSLANAEVIGGLSLGDKRDFEGIAFRDDDSPSVFLSEEDTPAVHEYSLRDGRRLRTVPTPAVFLDGHTVRNRGFESLTMSLDGKSLWTANEHALTIDGSPQTYLEPIASTTKVRLLRYAIEADGSTTPAEQSFYQTAGVHDLVGFNSLTDLAALPDGRLLALERSAARNLRGESSIRSRIFLIDPRHAPATSTTTAPSTRPIAKTLLFDGFVDSQKGQNMEGLCLGPALGPDRWSVLGVIDDSDGNLNLSRSGIVAFELRITGESP